MGIDCALDQADVEILCYEFSDEVLEFEAALGREKGLGNITLWYCTALYFCPGP